MKVAEIQELNTHYNFLMDFIGLADVYDENGLPAYSVDPLERMQECCYKHLDEDNRERLEALAKEMTELIEQAMDSMKLKAKRLSNG